MRKMPNYLRLWANGGISKRPQETSKEIQIFGRRSGDCKNRFYRAFPYTRQEVNNSSVFPIPGFCTEEIQVCKIKKFACKALKGRGSKSGIRVIYAFHVKILKVDFIEIYFKADQENEDRERIKQYLGSL